MQQHQPLHARTLSLLKGVVFLLKETFKEWSRDNASQLGAALAYYTALSLAPLLVLVVVVLSLVFGNTSAQGEIAERAQSVAGQDAARVIRTILRNTNTSGSGVLATIISIGMLMFGASGVFGQLKQALNTVWELKQRPGRGATGMLKERLVSFGMVLVAGSLLVVSLTLDTVLAGLSGALGSRLSALPDLIQLVELLRTLRFVKFLFSFGVFTLLFAFIYKAVPDAEVAWKDVWIGGAATSLLFTGGNLLIGIYLGRSSVGSAYGAAGSLVALLVWVYYSAQVFFFGAEFTQVYAEIHGSRILPDEDAVALVREERTRQEVFGMMRPRLMGLGRKKAKEEEAVETEEADMPTEVEVSAIAEDARSNRDHLLKYGGAAAGVLGLLAGAIAVISRIKDER